MFLAAPKKRLGFCSALASTPPVRILPECGDFGVVRASETRDRVEQDDDVLAELDVALGLLDHHLGDLNVSAGRLVERGADDFGLRRALHVGHFFGALVRSAG